jgi:copper(I)-binding protein
VNRALRAATMGVLLLSPVALSACSAGQVTQTATQERDKTGGMAQVGAITIRAAQLENPRGGAYEEGDDAELRLAIVNTAEETDTLTDISGEGFGDAEISARSASAATTSAPPAGATGTVPSTPATPRSSTSDEIEIPSDSTVFVGGEGIDVTLTDLDEALTTGQYLTLTLTFENAGDVEVTVTVATPEESEREEAFDFHEGEEGAEDAARERESREGEGS